MVVFNYSESLDCPEIVGRQRGLLSSYMEALQELGVLILEKLSQEMQMGERSRLIKAHTPGDPSTSSLSVLEYVVYDPKSQHYGHITHTDIGSLTFLYMLQSSLQVQSVGSQEWKCIEP